MTTRTSILRMVGMSLWLAFGAITLPMCGTGNLGFCDAKCDCEGCNDRKYDECLDDFDADERQADRLGCLDFFDDWTACIDSGDGCRGSDYDDGCKTEKDRWKNCVK